MPFPIITSPILPIKSKLPLAVVSLIASPPIALCILVTLSVIPVSKFDLFDLKEQLTAFNWMNTMPLSCKENLQKGNKIISSQVLEHFEKLKKYHNDNNWEIPIKYINLYAKHLDAGNPLESSTTTS